MSHDPDLIGSDAWTTIATLTDPVEAEMLEELLRNEGIAVAMPGLHHRAMLGVLGGYVSIPVQVPVRDSASARELLSAFRTSSAQAQSEDADANGPSPDRGGPRASATPDSSPPPSPKAAAGVAMLGAAVLASVGGGHLYVRQYVAAGSLFLLGWTTVIALLRGAETWPGIPLLIIIDMIGAATAARTQRRGHVVRTNRHGLAVIVLACTSLALSPFVARFLSYHFESPPPAISPMDHGPDWDGRTR